MSGSKSIRWIVVVAAAVGVGFLLDALLVRAEEKGKSGKKYRGRVGESTWKVKSEDGKTFLWAGGDRSGEGSQWYDFTGARIPTAHLQFGIGKDKIRAIDAPLFVPPDDPRLLKIPPSPYRTEGKPQEADEIMVIGYVEGDDARAYPVALLDHHELVNDRIGGKPITVGW